jgi:HAD superfamily hydrolase (TIGR01509 family)
MGNKFRFDLIIFDCDGVLIDSELLSCGALVDCLRRHAVEVDLEMTIERFLGRSPQAVSDYCTASGHRLPPEFFTELRAAVRAVFADRLKAMPDIETILTNLKTPYCVASSSDLERMDYSLRLTELLFLVAGRLFSAEMVAHGKPSPDLFLHAAASMGALPDKTLVVEDSVIGVAAAKAAGMTVWGFVGGSHYSGRDGRRPLLDAGADRIFDRMADFHSGPFSDGIR